MGQVMVSIKVYPESPEKVEDVKKGISQIVTIQKIREEEIAFGLKALIVTFIMGDDAGLDAIEEKIAAIPEVSQVQVLDMDRV